MGEDSISTLICQYGSQISNIAFCFKGEAWATTLFFYPLFTFFLCFSISFVFDIGNFFSGTHAYWCIGSYIPGLQDSHTKVRIMYSETNNDKNRTTGDISPKSGLLAQQQRQY